MPRTPPPKGTLRLAQALVYLEEHGITFNQSMFNRYVRDGSIPKHGPEKNGYYAIADLDKFIKIKLGLDEKEPATFMPATMSDMEDITRIAGLLFTSATITPIPALTRQTWLFKEPRGHYVVKRKDGRVAAFLHIVAVRHEWAERYIRGEVYGRNLTGDDIQKLEPGKPLSCVVISIGTDPGIESQSVKSHYVGVLLRGVENELEQMGREGIVISRLYAFSETKDGRSLCTKMGMQTVGYPQGQRVNFMMEPLVAPVPFLKRYQKNISTWLIQMAHTPESSRIDEKRLESEESTNTLPTSPKASYTRRQQHEDTIPEECISFTDMYQDHGVKESSARHGLEDKVFSTRLGSWYARGRTVRIILDRDNQRLFIGYVQTLPGYHRCEDEHCPCHE